MENTCCRQNDNWTALEETKSLPNRFYMQVNQITELITLPFQIGEARALYNLGNVYHAKGKHFGRNFHQDPGEFPEEVRSALERAIEFYE